MSPVPEGAGLDPAPRPVVAGLVLDGAGGSTVGRCHHGRFRRSALSHGGYEAEDFFPHYGDGGRWLFFIAAPLCNGRGKIVGAIATLQDVSQRRRAGEALRGSEERYRRLSLTDSLTGLFNSRHLHECLLAEVELAAPSRRRSSTATTASASTAASAISKATAYCRRWPAAGRWRKAESPISGAVIFFRRTAWRTANRA